MNAADEEPIPISALQHYVFCPRQCGLIHISRVWDENQYTQRGRRVHERVEQGNPTVFHGTRIERSLPLWSECYGLNGVADVVEFPEGGKPFPVEYKSGRRKVSLPDRIQLVGQALCLEEMFECSIPEGALFYYHSRRREIVRFDEELRARTVAIIECVRTLLSASEIPSPCNDSRCRHCSLVDACLPTLDNTLAEESLR